MKKSYPLTYSYMLQCLSHSSRVITNLSDFTFKQKSQIIDYMRQEADDYIKEEGKWTFDPNLYIKAVSTTTANIKETQAYILEFVWRTLEFALEVIFYEAEMEHYLSTNGMLPDEEEKMLDEQMRYRDIQEKRIWEL
jgi:hypothetical protein